MGRLIVELNSDTFQMNFNRFIGPIGTFLIVDMDERLINSFCHVSRGESIAQREFSNEMLHSISVIENTQITKRAGSRVHKHLHNECTLCRLTRTYNTRAQ